MKTSSETSANNNSIKIENSYNLICLKLKIMFFFVFLLGECLLCYKTNARVRVCVCVGKV